MELPGLSLNCEPTAPNKDFHRTPEEPHLFQGYPNPDKPNRGNLREATEALHGFLDIFTKAGEILLRYKRGYFRRSLRYLPPFFNRDEGTKQDSKSFSLRLP